MQKELQNIKILLFFFFNVDSPELAVQRYNLNLTSKPLYMCFYFTMPSFQMVTLPFSLLEILGLGDCTECKWKSITWKIILSDINIIFIKSCSPFKLIYITGAESCPRALFVDSHPFQNSFSTCHQAQSPRIWYTYLAP